MVSRMSMPRFGSVAPTPWRPAASWAHRGATALAALCAVALGTALGLALTLASIDTDTIGAASAGPWRLFLDVGTPAINPYARARMARTGAVPLAAAQGLTAIARVDSAGHLLMGHCRYRLSGSVPAARFWTLEAADPSGQPFDNPAGRQSFTSNEVLRDGSGAFTVALSPDAVPGNWLPLPGTGQFVLVMRLYDTGLMSGGAAGARGSAWPTIEALGCA